MRIEEKTVCVIGTGRVGLPLCLYLAEIGFKVYGIDVNQQMIETIKNGQVPFVEEGAAEPLKKYLDVSFFPTTNISVVGKCKFIILTLGTPVDENMNPSMVQIDSALQAASKYFKPGQTLILRSTVSPGTTEYVMHFLNKIKGINVGKNFYLAFCPERIAEGKALEELREIPQIIGGIDKPSSQKALELFKKFGVKCWLTDAVSAELSKLFTNMYRYITFGIANEFMILAGKYNRDIYEIVNLVNKDYKRGGLAMPGLTAGACLFKDGFFLINDIPFSDLISTSWKLNEAVPLYLVGKVKEKMTLADKKTVILGAAFKANIDDVRESLSFKVKKGLERERAQVVFHDPLIKEYNSDLEKALKGAELIFVATPHDYYKKNLTPKVLKRLVKKNCLICDVWNIFKTDKIIFDLDSLSRKANN